jgi:hypothetical protein
MAWHGQTAFGDARKSFIIYSSRSKTQKSEISEGNDGKLEKRQQGVEVDFSCYKTEKDDIPDASYHFSSCPLGLSHRIQQFCF